ncbi:glycosyltransferase [Candidatus Micrarchaeota archaeon]|nr:glycosyltransferase [Candidatus Micrarchaeota archaeon]
MKKNPLVSVVVCTIGAREIKNCIDSVLSSSYRNFELIVVDDGAKISLKPEGFVIVRQKHKGLTASRNTGIKNSKGKIIAFLDDDTKVEKNWIQEIVSSFESDKIGGVSGKSIEYFEDHTSENSLWTCNNYGLIKVNPKKMEKNDFIVVHGCNMAFSRKALEEVNFFDEKFDYFYDEIDLALRVSRKGFEIKVNPKAVVYHFIKSNARFGNKFEFGRFKYFFALRNFNSLFFFPLLVLNDLPFLFDDIRNSFKFFLKKKISFSLFFKDSYFIFAGRISGMKKFLLDK